MTTSIEGTDELRQEAVRRLEKRRELWMHAAAFVLVNGLLVTLWFLLGPQGFFWPVFPLFGWGIGLFFHGVEVLRRPYSEERIRREMERLHPSDQPR